MTAEKGTIILHQKENARLEPDTFDAFIANYRLPLGFLRLDDPFDSQTCKTCRNNHAQNKNCKWNQNFDWHSTSLHWVTQVDI